MTKIVKRYRQDKKEIYANLKGGFLTAGGIIIILLVLLIQGLFRGNSVFHSSFVMKIMLTVLLQGFSIYLYLTTLRLNQYACSLASVCYAYCGYFLASSSFFCNSTFVFITYSDQGSGGAFAGALPMSGILILFPLILAGIEKWLETGKNLLLILSLCLTAIFSSYFFYCSGLLAAFYFIFRLRQKKEKLLPKLTVFACLGIVSCLLCAFSLFSQTDGLVSPLGQTAYESDFALFVPHFKMWFTALARTLSNDILGNPYTNFYRGYTGDYFQVSTYFSAFFITLAWICFVNEKSMRKKLLSVILTAFVLTAFPAISLVLSAFSGVQTLWMFLIPVLQALLTALALDSVFRRGEIKQKLLLQGMLVSFLLIFLSQTALSIGLNDFTGNLKNYLILSKKYLLVIAVLHSGLLLLWFTTKRIASSWRKNIFVGGLLGLFILDILMNCRHMSDYGFAAEAFSYGNILNYVPVQAIDGQYGMLISLSAAAFLLLHSLLQRKSKYRLLGTMEASVSHLEESGNKAFRKLFSSLSIPANRLTRTKLFPYIMSLFLSACFVLGTLFLFTPESFAWNRQWILIIIVSSVLCCLPVLFFFKSVKRNTAVYQKRSSNIELCRVICMLLVVLHHYALHGGSFFISEMNTNKIYAMFLTPGGKLSYDCFLAISCWFLVDQKFSTRRFIRTWLQVLFYTVSVSAVVSLISGCLDLSFSLSINNWIGTLLPLSGNSHSFAASYLALYLLTPFLSKITDTLSKRQARWLMLLLFYLETVTQLIGSFTQYHNSLFSDLLLFILCYIIAFNLKRWPLKIMDNSRKLLCIFACCWLAMWMLEYAYTVSPGNQLLVFIEANMLASWSVNNLIGGFALFFWFKNLKLTRPLPLINALATGTFGVLLIHDHNFFRNILWGHLINTPAWHDSNLLIVHSLAAALWIFVICIAIDRLRQTLLEKNIMKSRLLNAFCERCDMVINEKKAQ